MALLKNCLLISQNRFSVDMIALEQPDNVAESKSAQVGWYCFI